MFLQCSLFVVNFLLSAFKFLLLGAFGSILSIYSQVGDEYANSIRWMRQDGALATMKALFNTRKNIPLSTTIAVLAIMIAGILSGIVDKGIILFFHPSTRLGNKDYTVVTTFQHVPQGTLKTFSGWSFSMQYGADIVEATAQAISGTTNIPGASSSQVYTPQIHKYEVGCSRFDLQPLNRGYSNLTLDNNGCAIAAIWLFDQAIYDFKNATFTTLYDGRWRLSIPGDMDKSDQYADIAHIAGVISGATTCGTMDMTYNLRQLRMDGLSEVPRTMTTKCVPPAGDVHITTITTTRFAVSHVERFRKTATSVIAEYDELLQAMEISLRKATFKSSTTMLVEIKYNNSTIDTLGCTAAYLPNVTEVGVTCAYGIASLLVLKPQTINPLLREARGGRPFPPTKIVSAAMVIEHIPRVNNGTAEPISMATLRNATNATTHYMASLGQNFYADYLEGKLYTIYDTYDVQSGFEVPLGMLVCIGVVMVLCLCFWALTEFLLNPRYTSSIHKVISIQLGIPGLMRSKVGPIEFEGVPLVPEGDIYRKDDDFDADRSEVGNDSKIAPVQLK
ncbi:hypothetical protein B0O80DRAFT_67030 [Mortierella sp. GBAus27b]|nr:hypothetical protein BGX31_010324 [Mortierella sp. GBA43]KAI8353977.1 hypothetical protein B0O80DRAFT_67030 [Mortierella sp. GBAus27b]